MTTLARLMTPLISLTLAGIACAADTVDVTVTGRITPDACLIALSDDGAVDHGRIPSHTLAQDAFTVLPSRFLELNIQCARPMLFALAGIDNRATSSLDPDMSYGLGSNPHAPEERLGAITLSYHSAVGDTQPMQVLVSADAGETWAPDANAYPRRYMGFALPGDRQPDYLGQLNAQLRIDTSVNFARDLTLDQEVPLDGSIVLDLRYL